MGEMTLTRGGMREYQRQRRANNGEQERARARDYYAEVVREKNKGVKRQLVEYLGGKCSVCGRKYPLPCYDFHHKEPHKKEINIGAELCRGFETLKLEADKCVLVCANCHRIEHSNDKRFIDRKKRMDEARKERIRIEKEIAQVERKCTQSHVDFWKQYYT